MQCRLVTIEKRVWFQTNKFLGAFAKFRKATVSFELSVWPHGTTRLRLDGFYFKKVTFEYFSKICPENSSFVRSNKNTLHEDQYIFLIVIGSVLLRMRNFSDKRCRENQNTHFTFSILFFRKSYLFRKFVQKIQASLDRTRILYMKTNIYFWS